MTILLLNFTDSSSTFYLDTPKTEDIRNANPVLTESVPTKPQVQENDNAPGSSTPVKIRRQNTKKVKIDKNITEEQVYDELRKLCSGETPEEKYITKIMELGAGAGGVVTLAKVRIHTA